MANGEILAVRIASAAAHNGWVAEIDIENLAVGGAYDFGLGANNDPSAAHVVFSVRSDGYDNAGSATHITRTIHGTQWVRKPYPNHATANEGVDGTTLTVRVALSDFIFSSDDNITVSIASGFYTKTGVPNNAVTDLAVTNNSTLAHPKCVGRWAWPGYERITTDDFLVEVVAFHRSGMNGKPLACCKITATDESAHSVSKTITSMTVSTRTGDANKVLVYAATFAAADFAGLDQGEIVTFRFQCYPWVGDAGAVLDSDTGADGVAQPDERMGPLYAVLDKDGSYGQAWAVVDHTNGQAYAAEHDHVYATQAEAEAGYASATSNSYLHVGDAAQAIKHYNNAHNSRNEPGGGVILLNSASHAWVGNSPGADMGVMNVWLTVQPLSTVARADAIIASGSWSYLYARRIKLYNVSVTNPNAAAFIGTLATDVIWLDNCVINVGAGEATFYHFNQLYATHNSITALPDGLRSYGTGAARTPHSFLRGNIKSGAVLKCEAYCIIGNAQLGPFDWRETGNAQGEQVGDNAVIAFNTVYNISISWFSGIQDTTLVIGVAFVQNVAESQSAINPMIICKASSPYTATPVNVIFFHNTFAGARENFGYNGAEGTYVYNNWSQIGNIWDDWNVKGDVFDTNGAHLGNWMIEYNVGFAANMFRTSQFLPSFNGLYSFRSGTTEPGYVDDNSLRGSGTGNGDYHLAAGSNALNLIASGKAVLPFDLEGTARRNDGTGAAGAYEFPGGPTVTPLTVAGGLTPTGAIGRQTGKGFSGSGTPTGALLRSSLKSYAGALTPTGTLARSMARALAGALTPAGALIRSVRKAFSGALSPTGSLSAILQTAVKYLNVSGSITSAGSLIRQTTKSLAGALTPTGTLTNLKTFLLSLAGAITPTGLLTNIKTKLLDLAGALQPAGSLIKDTSRSFTGALTPVGSLLKSTARDFAGALTPTGALTVMKTFVLAVAGTLTPAGELVRRTAKGFAGSIASAGSLVKQATKTFAGAITPAGIVAAIKTFTLAISGAITPTGSLVRSIGKGLAGVMPSAGSVSRSISKSFAGVIASIGAFAAYMLGERRFDLSSSISKAYTVKSGLEKAYTVKSSISTRG